MIARAPPAPVSQAQQRAPPGEGLLAPDARQFVAEVCVGQALGTTNGAAPPGPVRLDAVRAPLALRPEPRPLVPAGADGALRPYIPGAVISRLAAGQTGWLAELRRVTVLFLNLPD